MSELQMLTNSRRNSFGTCHKRHYFEYEICRRPLQDAQALWFGDLVHKGLEAWYLNHWRGLEIAAVEAMAAINAHGQKCDPYAVAAALAMLEGYGERYGADDFRVLAVEQHYEIPLVNPDTNAPSRTWKLAGKLDAIIERDGKVFIVEHKTTSDSIAADSRYWTKLAIDGQVSGYYMGCQALGWSPDGCEYDVLAKPTFKPRNVPLVDADGVKIILDANGERVRNKDGKTWRQTGDTAQGFTLQTRLETVDELYKRVRADIAANPDEYYRRQDVPRLDADLVEYLGDMWAVGREIADAQTSGRWPKNPRSCDIYSGCPYFEVCANRESIENPHVFKDTPVHPELITSEASR